MSRPVDDELPDDLPYQPEESDSAPDMGLPDDILAEETAMPEAPDVRELQEEHADVFDDMGEVSDGEVASAVENNIADTPLASPSEAAEPFEPEVADYDTPQAPSPEAAEHAQVMGDMGNVAARELPAYNPTSAMDDLRRTGREGTVEHPQFQKFAAIPGMHTVEEFFPEGDPQASAQAGEAELRSAVRQTAESASSFLAALTEYVMDLGHEVQRLRTMLELDRL